MSIFHFGKIVLEIGIHETIKILMVCPLKKYFSFCDDKKKSHIISYLEKIL